MKKFVLALFAIVPLVGCGSIVSLQISGDPATQAGYQAHGKRVVISQTVPLYCRIIMEEKEVAVLGPGDTAYDDLFWVPTNLGIPVAALCYADPERTQYVGADGTILSVDPWNRVPVSWEIRNVRTPDGSYPQELRTPAERKPRSVKMDLRPRRLNGEAVVQLVNNTHLTMSARVNGQETKCQDLGPTSVCSLWGGTSYLSYSAIVELSFTNDRGQYAGKTTLNIYVPTQGSQGYQRIVTDSEVRL